MVWDRIIRRKGSNKALGSIGPMSKRNKQQDVKDKMMFNFIRETNLHHCSGHDLEVLSKHLAQICHPVKTPKIVKKYYVRHKLETQSAVYRVQFT